MISIQCTEHEGYNGGHEPGMPCDACWQIYTIRRSERHFENLRIIQPIKLVNQIAPMLGIATTGEMIEEIRMRCDLNGTLDYMTMERRSVI